MNNTLRYLATTYLWHLAQHNTGAFFGLLILAAVVVAGLVRGEERL